MKRHTLLAAPVVAVLALSGALVQAGPALGSSSGPPRLADLVLDQIGRLDQPFSPTKRNYSATAYRSLDQLGIHAIPDSDGETVSINGQAPGAQGRVTVPLKVGRNDINVVVKKAGKSNEYKLKVTKVDTDYRGRVPVPAVTATSQVGASEGHPVTNLVDGDPETTWAPPFPFSAGKPDDPKATQFVLDLKEPRWVGKLTGSIKTLDRTWFPDEQKNFVTIDVSPDGKTWTQAANHAPLRTDQGLIYWDFNRYFQGRYVRVTLAAADAQVLNWLEWRGFDVHALPQGANPPANLAGPVKPGKPTKVVGKAPNGDLGVNRAQELAIEGGLTWSGWAPSGGWAAATPDAKEYAGLESPTALFYDPPLSNTEFMANNPNATWGIAKAPFGGNAIGNVGEPRDYLPEAMKPFVANYVDAQYGDEGNYSLAEVEAFRKWFAFSKTTYPQAMVHSNQYDGSSWNQLANYRNYVKTAKPDLASFDRYYWGGGGVFGSHGPKPWQTTSTLLGTGIWQTQRQAALEGLTGDGSQPVMFGQYLDAFDFNGSQSQKSIVTSLSLATGMKWLSLFRLESNRFDGTAFFDQDGAPLRSYFEYADIATRAKNLGTYLTPLNNAWFSTIPGSHLEGGKPVTNPVTTGWRMQTFGNSAAANATYGLRSVTARNTGVVNDGLAGDVSVGYFAPLPGLNAKVLNDRFGTANPRAFMVVNGLTGETKLPSTKLLTRVDDGQHWQASQEITIEVAPPSPSSTLMQVDPATGRATSAEVVKNANGAQTTTVSLGGGQSTLFYWTQAPLRIESSISSASVPTGGTTDASVTFTNDSAATITPGTVAAKAPSGWSVVGASTLTVPALAPGASHTAKVTFRNDSSIGSSTLELTLLGSGTSTSYTFPVSGTCGAPAVSLTVVGADSQETVGENAPATKAVDGNTATFWHTKWKTTQTAYPHWIVVDAKASAARCGLSYLPRQDVNSGRVKDYEVYVSDVATSFPSAPTAKGTFADTGTAQVVPLAGKAGRYVKLVGLNAWDGKPFMTAAEITLR